MKEQPKFISNPSDGLVIVILILAVILGSLGAYWIFIGTARCIWMMPLCWGIIFLLATLSLLYISFFSHFSDVLKIYDSHIDICRFYKLLYKTIKITDITYWEEVKNEQTETKELTIWHNKTLWPVATSNDEHYEVIKKLLASNNINGKEKIKTLAEIAAELNSNLLHNKKIKQYVALSGISLGLLLISCGVAGIVFPEAFTIRTPITRIAGISSAPLRTIHSGKHHWLAFKLKEYADLEFSIEEEKINERTQKTNEGDSVYLFIATEAYQKKISKQISLTCDDERYFTDVTAYSVSNTAAGKMSAPNCLLVERRDMGVIGWGAIGIVIAVAGLISYRKRRTSNQ